MRTGIRTLASARRLRRQLSPPEVRLWVRLRAPGDGCPRWRRQHPVGPYVLDFYCPAARLAVEVDGISHSMGDRSARDERRDAWLVAQGITVMRIEAVDVLRDPDDVAHMLTRQAMALVRPPPSRA